MHLTDRQVLSKSRRNQVESDWEGYYYTCFGLGRGWGVGMKEIALPAVYIRIKGNIGYSLLISTGFLRSVTNSMEKHKVKLLK